MARGREKALHAITDGPLFDWVEGGSTGSRRARTGRSPEYEKLLDRNVALLDELSPRAS